METIEISPYAIPGIAKERFKALNVTEALDIIKRWLNIEDLSPYQTPNRSERYRAIRQRIMYLLRYWGFTLYSIGAIFRRDHATVLHACRSVENDMLTDKELTAWIKAKKESINKLKRHERNNN